MYEGNTVSLLVLPVDVYLSLFLPALSFVDQIRSHGGSWC